MQVKMPCDLKAELAKIERRLIVLALDREGNNHSRAARLLSISRQGLLKKMDRFNLRTRTRESVEKLRSGK